MINNPLVGVLNFAQILNRRLPSDDPNRELVAMIEEGAARCRDIVKALLHFGRQDTVGHGLVSLQGVVAEAVRISRHQVELGGGELEVSIASEVPTISGNVVQLTQVLLNLIGNAAQARADGIITVRLEHKEELVHLQVSDNGPGISSDIRPNIFDPFFTTKEEGEGTGLGLSVAYSIIKQHKGMLALVEETDCEGATFLITLPAMEVGQEETI